MNQLDLYQKLNEAEENLEHSITSDAKAFWKREVAYIKRVIKHLYPDLYLSF